MECFVLNDVMPDLVRHHQQSKHGVSPGVVWIPKWPGGWSICGKRVRAGRMLKGMVQL